MYASGTATVASDDRRDHDRAGDLRHRPFRHRAADRAVRRVRRVHDVLGRPLDPEEPLSDVSIKGSTAVKAGNSTIYRGKGGQWAFVAHRISGFLVFMFLLLHVVDVSLINVNPKLYNEVHNLYGNVLLRLF